MNPLEVVTATGFVVVTTLFGAPYVQKSRRRGHSWPRALCVLPIFFFVGAFLSGVVVTGSEPVSLDAAVLIFFVCLPLALMGLGALSFWAQSEVGKMGVGVKILAVAGAIAAASAEAISLLSLLR